jgi:prepilin-type N-terminal cleavage/methylation domain-containing protein
MNTKRGFTLIELLVVIGIIGILIVALVPVTQGAIQKAKETKVKVQASQIETSLIGAGYFPGVAIDKMAPYEMHGLGDPVLYAGAAANAFDAAPGLLVNGVLGGYGHYNGVATGWAEQLNNVKNLPWSGNEGTKRYFDALLQSDALQEFPENPLATTGSGERVAMRNIFTFQLDVAGGFDPSSSFGPGMLDPTTAFYDCALVVSGGGASGAGAIITPDTLDTLRSFLQQDPLPGGIGPENFSSRCLFGTDDEDWFAPGDFAYIPILTTDAGMGDATATLENEAYKYGVAVDGYLFFAYGSKDHKGTEFRDEQEEFMNTGLPGYGNPGVDTLYETYALMCFEGAIYYSKKLPTGSNSG